VSLHFLKGHGTENDFVLLPDADGTLGAPSADLVRRLCDRHAGLAWFDAARPDLLDAVTAHVGARTIGA